ncbi:MAG TPA: GFA family protein [Polyangiaceae bacterium]|jgi:hypothetical protein|nr:GFA family protein [Polyangiaceae bacterium]
MKIRGACVCGAVAFEIEEPFVAFQYCHCSRCRKKSGSAHCANAFVPKAQFAWLRGEDHVGKFELEGTRWSSAFCKTCGCAAPWLNRPGTTFLVPAGSLDDAIGERPRRNIHFASRAAWYVHASTLETFEALP